METSKDADVPRKRLTLVVQLPEFPQLDLAQLLSEGRNCQLGCSSGALASITLMISGERALKIEKQLAQLLDVEVDELRDYLAGNIRTSSTRRTGFRFVRGTHGGHYVRDREGTDIGPAGVSVR